MTSDSTMISFSPAKKQLIHLLQRCNSLNIQYGLTLNPMEMEMLAVRQASALKNTGRIEFGQGPYEKIMYAFCDSPHVTQTNYAELLADLCETFYHFKGESREDWSDDELIDAMAYHFNGDCQGSVALMADRLWQSLHDEDEVKEENESIDI